MRSNSSAPACWHFDTTPGFWRARGGLVLILGLLAGLLSLAGCGDGGETQSTPLPVAAAMGSVSGRLIVSPNHAVEVEPNNAPDQAQPIAPTETVFGNAAAGDAGFFVAAGDVAEVEDLYVLMATSPVRLVLTMASDDLAANDLDLFLMDPDGNALAVSEGQRATEIIDTPGSGPFLIGVRAHRGASAYTLTIVPADGLASFPSSPRPPGATFVPGEILVQMKPGATDARLRASELARTYGLRPVVQPDSGPSLMRLSTRRPLSPGKTAANATALQALTLDTLRALRADPAVAYAEPNYLRQPTAVPDDAFFASQWHLGVLNLPQAWDLTTGHDTVIVAVIDTGILMQHPDLQGRLMEGYDFISDATRANDGDGIDADPTDVGDAPAGVRSLFHGTHVAGIIGALTHNAIGVAGVTWHTRLMPLRVSGIGGATDADIAQAIRYAAGLPNRSGTLPSAPAHLINLSLSGPGFSRTLHEAIQAAIAQGVMVIAAAGNQNLGEPFYPAAHDGVIAVAAVNRDLQKASYSNFGSSIDVAAPGGDVHADRDGDGVLDGILSTTGNGAGQFLYDYLAGTSMAAPQMTGVLALMLAVNPDLTLSDVERLLAGTHPDTDLPITTDLGPPGRDHFFGHGLIDALQAVQAAQALPGGTGALSNESVLEVSTTALPFGAVMSVLPIEITNAGGRPLQIVRITSDAEWLEVVPDSGTAPFTVYAIVDRSHLAAGTYTATLQITSDASDGDDTATIAVTMEVGETPMGDIGSAYLVVIDVETSTIVAQMQTNALQGYAFTIPELPPGIYRLVAGTDRDQDGTICETGDACGVSLDLVTITAGHHTDGLRLVIDHATTAQRIAPVILP